MLYLPDGYHDMHDSRKAHHHALQINVILETFYADNRSDIHFDDLHAHLVRLRAVHDIDNPKHVYVINHVSKVLRLGGYFNE